MSPSNFFTAPSGPVDVDALAVARVGLEAELVEGLDERILVGRDPLAADLEHGAVDLAGPQAPADAVARLEHDDRRRP